MFEASGLGRLVVRELGLGDPEVAPDLDSWRALVDRIKAPEADPRDRPGRQVHRAARRLPVGHRGAPPCGLGARGRRQGPLGRFRGADPREPARATRGRRPASSSPAASAIAASRARSLPPTSPASTASRTSACAWGCSAPSSSSPARSSVPATPTRPSSTCSPTTRSSTSCPTSATWRTRAARCASASTRPS